MALQWVVLLILAMFLLQTVCGQDYLLSYCRKKEFAALPSSSLNSSLLIDSIEAQCDFLR